MNKRLFDIAGSAAGLVLLTPLLAIVAFLVWLEDRHNPLYIASRVGLDGHPFKMVKLRSMIVNAEKSGVDSTAKDDSRITRTGKIVRKLKLDEFTQLWNVLKGEMSLVGPRPNVERDVRLYSEAERRLLSVRPGITDFASVVFSDEGEILEGSPDPDLLYNQIIRPWKSRLGLHYIRCSGTWLDIKIIAATVLSSLSRQSALTLIARLLEKTGADRELISVARRTEELRPAPPPGFDDIVRSRTPDRDARTDGNHGVANVPTPRCR